MANPTGIQRIRPNTPGSFLRAAEFEDRGLGNLSTNGRDLQYVDRASRITMLTVAYSSIREAKLQLEFFRKTHQDVKARRAEIVLVSG